MTLQAVASVVSSSLRSYRFGLPMLVLVAFLGLGELTKMWVHTWIPGSVIGMLLLSVALWSGLLKESFLENTSEWLLANLGLFFICPGVEIINFLGLVGEHWLSLTVAIVGSSLVTLIATGAVSAGMSVSSESRSGKTQTMKCSHP